MGGKVEATHLSLSHGQLTVDWVFSPHHARALVHLATPRCFTFLQFILSVKSKMLPCSLMNSDGYLQGLNYRLNNRCEGG